MLPSEALKDEFSLLSAAKTKHLQRKYFAIFAADQIPESASQLGIGWL